MKKLMIAIIEGLNLQVWDCLVSSVGVLNNLYWYNTCTYLSQIKHTQYILHILYLPF